MNVESPDINSTGFLRKAPSATRYEHLSYDENDVLTKIASFITPGSRILDVGCGTGVITAEIKNRTRAQIIGIEPDAQRAEMARGRGLDVITGFLTKEFLQDQRSFDHVLFVDVLEHLENPAALVAIAKSGLRPGGSVIVSVPNIAHWFVRTDLLRGRFNYQDCGIMDATHLRWFTRKTIVEFFERLGLTVEGLNYTVNIDLPDYNNRFPWRLMSKSLKKGLVVSLIKMFPTLFGCQLIVKASLKQ